MMQYVLDACAMIAYLRDEPGADGVESVLSNRRHRCYAHAINLCEAYYDFLRAKDEKMAKDAIADLLSPGVEIRQELDTAFWQEAGKYKAGIKKISLADCFAMALANHLKAELVTSDHAEFDQIAESGACAVKFIR
jgi:PIN domain nuclease of toxin-antitoxin system